MDYPKVTRLYKYTSFTERSISALVTGKLWYPKPNSLNDPFDCVIVDHSKGLLADIKKQGRELVKKKRHLRPDVSNQTDTEKRLYSIHDNFFNTITERDKELIDATQNAYSVAQSTVYNFGILSLSETPKSILMWSHYALNHTGIVFEFERSDDNKLGNDARHVTYSHRRENGDDESQDSIYNLFFVKFKGWHYEKEWRLLENKGNEFYDFPGKLKSLICGALMPKKNIETITLLIESINLRRHDKISVKFANMNNKRYTISIRKGQSKN